MERKELIRVEIIGTNGRKITYSTFNKADADQMTDELKTQHGVAAWVITLEVNRGERTMPEPTVK